MSLLLAVDPRSYQAASAVFGSQIADALTETGGRLTGALTGLTGMAGADATGASWVSAYNPLCADTIGAVEDAINGCLRLGALLQQTGFNHALADARSAGEPSADADHASYDREVFLGAAPRVRGSAGHAPHGWGIVAHVVGHAWPGGHQNQLRSAALAWASAGDRVHAAGELVGFAVDAVRAQLSPETDDAVTVCVATRARLFELAGSCRVLGRACTEYADALDHARSRIEHELAEFLAWSAVIEFGGLALAVFSAGASEGGAQVVEAGRIAATGARIAAILAEFGPAVARAGAHLAELAGTVAGVRAALRALRDRPVVDASADILVVPGPAQRAQLKLELSRDDGRRTAITGPKTFDPASLEGLSIGDVIASIPPGWRATPSRSGGGVVYEDPARRGRQIRVMPGYEPGSRPGQLTAGPYAVVSQNGQLAKVALRGNPTLR